MKVLICGSRNINNPALFSRAVEQSSMNPTHIISGGARGVDTLARRYARSAGIEFTEYLADWDKYGKRAGFLRNITMIGVSDAVIAIWMVRVAERNTRSTMRPRVESRSLFLCKSSRLDLGVLSLISRFFR